MDITTLLSGEKGQQIIQEISGKTGIPTGETASVVNAAGPVLLGMLHKNAATESGAQNLFSALSKHDGSILDDLKGLLGSAGTLSDGDGILGHVLGDNRSSVESALSSHTGVSASNVSKILTMLAPVIMGYLGKQSRSGNLTSGSGIGGLLGSLLGSGSSATSGGNILSSVLGNVLGSSGKSGGLGGLLGGLFEKK